MTTGGALDRYRLLVNSMDQAFCVIEMIFDEGGDPIDYRFVELNSHFEDQTGLRDALGKRIREFLPHHEQHWFDVYGRVARTGDPIRFENSSSGMNRIFSVYAFRMGGPDSRRVAVIFSDITARKRMERCADFLSELSQRLSAERHEAQIIKIAVEALGRHMDVDRCYFVECVEPMNLVLVSYNWRREESPSLEGRYNLHDFGGIDWWRGYCAGNFAVTDVETDPLTREKKDNYAALGVRSYAVQPFRRDGESTVILGVTESTPRTWTEEDLRLLDDVAARVWPLVQRARVDQELRRSEAFLQSVIRATADCIKVLSLEGRIQWISENGQRLMEVSDMAQVRDAFWPDFSPDEAVRQEARAAVENAREGRVGRFRGFCPTFAGNPKWWDVIVTPITGIYGKPVQLLSVARDVTSVREVEEKLRNSQVAIERHAQTLEARLEELRAAKAQSESTAKKFAESSERLRLLSEVVSLQVWTATVDGALDYANQECVEYMGADLQQEIRGDGWTQFVHPDDLPKVRSLWRESIATGARYEVEFRVRGKSGAYRWFLVRAEALRDEAGRIIKWFGSNTDIDELKSAQAAAERASRAKDDFLAALSHELRTPLTPVLLTAAVLRHDPRFPDDVREQLAMMERNIELEARLIDDLLDLTTISHGKLQLRAQSCDAHALIDLALDIVRKDAEAKGIEIARSFAAQTFTIMADPARFQQVVWNLLRNAVKFTPAGGKISIRTSAERRPDGDWWLRIKVADTGIGIDPSLLDKIFRPFEQGDRKGAHRFGGLGLGLAIARAVMDLHGGRITAESAGENRGATFLVELPLVTSSAMNSPAVPRLSTDAAAGNGGSSKPSSTAVSLRLLLVEDDESSLDTLSRLLRRDGHRVMAVGTVEASMAAAAEHEFDVVISDIGLPDGTGTELMEKLRATYGLRGVALSGYGMEDDLVRTREAGFLVHLIKPIQIAELRRVLVSLGPAGPSKAQG